MQVKRINKRPISVLQRKRVCAYARVSTDSRRQEDSLENQIEAYKRLITKSEYEFARYLPIRGISGYWRNVRSSENDGKGKSRRDRSDYYKIYIKILREIRHRSKVCKRTEGTGCRYFFEEQNMNTLSGDGEMMLAVLASLHRKRDRSMSENNKWSIKKKFERGEVMITPHAFGYDKMNMGI